MAISEFEILLNKYIEDWFTKIELPSEPANLYNPINYTMQSGGKRIRPTLLLASLMAFGGDIDYACWPCRAIEMFHNFTLVHDDVMDESPTRRGRPTVHSRWDENTAILSGDTMLTLAEEYLCRCSDKHLRPVIEVFNRTAIEVYEGQQLDMDFEKRDEVSVEEYLTMIRLKTSVLLGCALKIGAILANAKPTDADTLYNFGIALGIGFQLRDDYLDTFGSPEIFGKPIGGDIIRDKKTWLMIKCRQILENNLQIPGEKDSDKVDRIRNLYIKQGLDKEILQLISEYSNTALSYLDKLNITPESRQYFEELVTRLMYRDK